MRRLWCAALVAMAAPMASARAEAITQVEVSIAASEKDSGALEEVLRDLLGTTGLPSKIARVSSIDPRSVIEPPASFAPGVARVFVEVGGDVARVYLVDAAWARVLVRRIPLPKGLDEIAREQIGHIVAGAIDALAAGATIGITREEARVELGVKAKEEEKPPPRSPPPPIPIPPPKPPPSPTASLGVGYEGAAWSNAIAWHALDAQLSLRLPNALGFSIAGLARLPVTVEHRAVGMRVDAWGARAEIGWSPLVSSRMRFLASVGGGFDHLRIEPRAQGTAIGGEVRDAWNPVLRASLGFETRISETVWGKLSFFVEGDLGARTYVVVTDTGADETVVEPFRIRPGLAIAVVTNFL
jgi:hypothetical protein